MNRAASPDGYAPTLAFSGISNFRDFGSGVAPKRWLFRSGHLAKATADDIGRLESLNIRTIIDLRRPSERQQQPSPSIAGTRVITCDDGDRSEAPHLEFLRQGDASDEAVEEFLVGYYRKAPFEPRHIELFSHAFHALKEGPVLIHCTAGKDRTGVLAALILSHYGAAWETITADFLLTNAAMLREPHITQARELGRQLLSREPGAAAIRAMLGVEGRHLAAAFDAIRANTGDLKAYLATLGVEPPIS